MNIGLILAIAAPFIAGVILLSIIVSDLSERIIELENKTIELSKQNIKFLNEIQELKREVMFK